MTVTQVFEVTTATFEQEVMQRSKTTPVLLDFWAEWCEPCKTLGPVLERLADEFGGSFLLGKVDSEQQSDLAYAFQVQGIPFCVLLVDGRPVDGFQGALAEEEIRKFLQKHSIAPAGGVSEQAEEEVDPDSSAARLQRALAAAASGSVADARAELADFPQDDEDVDRARRLGEAMQFLEASLDEQGSEVEVVLKGAREQLLAGNKGGAMEQILEAVAMDKSYANGLPRQAMLLCFLLVGEEDERLDPFRRRLATLLY